MTEQYQQHNKKCAPVSAGAGCTGQQYPELQFAVAGASLSERLRCPDLVRQRQARCTRDAGEPLMQAITALEVQILYIE